MRRFHLASITNVARFIALATTLVATTASAEPFDEYAGGPFSVTYPGNSFSLIAEFPPQTTAIVDGYRLAGRLLGVDGSNVYIQKNPGSDIWLHVATTEVPMDPTFLAISPNGETIAIGVGWEDPMVLVPSEDLSVSAPIDLATWPSAKTFVANYYDAAWLDDRYLLVNEGWFSGSRVYVIDTAAPDPGLTFVTIIDDIPGASSGIAIDRDGNVVTGVGAGSATGELRIFSSASILDAIATGEGIMYAAAPLLAESVSSANNLTFDVDGNLLVAGGDYVGGSGDGGYFAILHADVMARVLANGGPPLDESDEGDYSELHPAGCTDVWVNVEYLPTTQMLLAHCGFASTPYEAFFAANPPDADADGIPDGVDNAQWYPNPDQEDANDDGIGDAGDLDLDGDGILGAREFSAFVNAFQAATGEGTFDPKLDFDFDGTIDWDDYRIFRARWSLRPPY